VLGVAPEVVDRARAAATQAFVHGFSETLYVNAAVLFVGALLALLFVKSDTSGGAQRAGQDITRESGAGQHVPAALIRDVHP
jgi:H+/gluconate symporter-like permease